MKKIYSYIKDIMITILILCISFGISILFQKIFDVPEHISTIFVFAVFLISLNTDGYIFGIVAAFLSTIAVNYAFTFPFFKFDFIIPVNFISAIIMVGISLMTSALTTKVKRWETLKSEGERERMRANLLRAVSHDLRTPLTTIYGSSSAILENETNLTEEQKMKMLQGIKEDAQWLIRMVENLLSITKIDSGKVKIHKEPTVLDELIDAVIVKFKKRYPDQKVNLDLPEEFVMIPIDAILIEQVLINLLENAVQHAVGMTKLTLKVFLLDNRAIFEISDNGCGIPNERLKTIFTGYYNEEEEQPADGQKRNAGIGLSVCSTIIKAHGSEIRAENKKSGGAIFRFALDIEEESELEKYEQ